ncbi:isochorismate synthase [Streptomyces poonensis]|uniref:isochorismate synthase n=1 Tax=Streptomyces poonensis TaxID=68255 RepID=UPI001676735E|nr:isochorismate synthase [Streptomyces poonensis]
MASGSAIDLTGRGDGRFDSVQGKWRALAGQAVVAGTDRGPLLVGGFAFRPSPRDAGERQGLPDGLMWVPQVVFLTAGDGATETVVSSLVTPRSSPADVADALMALAGDARKNLAARTGCVPPARRAIETVDLPVQGDWNDLVKKAAEAIEAGAFEKVVLARAEEIRADEDFDVPAALSLLEQEDPGTAVFGAQVGRSWFIGATPEYLLTANGPRVETLALAGSARRDSSPLRDRALARELMSSVKERHEHRLVADALTAFLDEHCRDVHGEAEPQVAKFARIQHLRTRLRGTRRGRDTKGLLGLVAALHPTPALGGHPRPAALDWLDTHEKLDRGWYAAPLGWTDREDDGEFAVTIRSALVQGDRATLYAGCGVVAGSVPDNEYRETALKLRVMRAALGLDRLDRSQP